MKQLIIMHEITYMYMCVYPCMCVRARARTHAQTHTHTPYPKARNLKAANAHSQREEQITLK